MGTFLTNGVPSIAAFTGSEEMLADTGLPSGAIPQQVKVSLSKLALLMTSLLNTLNKTMVAGSIYYTQFSLGQTLSTPPSSAPSNVSQESFVITGVNVPIGTTGGTDNWIVAIYNAAGVLLGKSAATLAGTASTVQQIALSAALTVPSGSYFIALQSNGTTATFKALNSPIWSGVTGSQTGVAGTMAALSPVPTTYTANVGPAASVY